MSITEIIREIVRQELAVHVDEHHQIERLAHRTVESLLGDERVRNSAQDKRKKK